MWDLWRTSRYCKWPLSLCRCLPMLVSTKHHVTVSGLSRSAAVSPCQYQPNITLLSVASLAVPLLAHVSTNQTSLYCQWPLSQCRCLPMLVSTKHHGTVSGLSLIAAVSPCQYQPNRSAYPQSVLQQHLTTCFINGSDGFTAMHRQILTGGKKISHSVFIHWHSVSVVSEHKSCQISITK